MSFPGVKPAARTSLERCSQQLGDAWSVRRADEGAEGGSSPQRALTLVLCTILRRCARARCRDMIEALVLLTAGETFDRGPVAGCWTPRMRNHQ
ncbi:hypothetical protein PC123_g22755 [Phytophthora cactorum]|nr:hypothetical protein PC120_g22034 [Phytophthora cactorum]KAG4041736.1 hypothetical protein PC123_g22755 [Phytophthora cactorum]